MLILFGKNIKIRVEEDHEVLSENFLKTFHLITCFGKTVSVLGTTKMSVPNIKMIEKIKVNRQQNIYVKI